MRKMYFLFAMFLSCSMLFAQQPEVVLEDFDGTTFPGTNLGFWSYSYAMTPVANPVTDGINSSDSCMYYPSHVWYSAWGWIGGFLAFPDLPPDLMNDNTVDDIVNILLRFKGGTGSEDWVDTVQLDVVAGADNEWQAVYMEIPAEMIPTDHTQLELSCFPDLGVVGMYWDNFGLTNTLGTGIQRNSAMPDFSAFMLEDQLHISLDEPLLVRSVEVYNISGARVFHRKMNTVENKFSLSLDVNSGVYVVRINADRGAYTKKFVKY
jgi:hypothetical protein